MGRRFALIAVSAHLQREGAAMGRLIALIVASGHFEQKPSKLHSSITSATFQRHSGNVARGVSCGVLVHGVTRGVGGVAVRDDAGDRVVGVSDAASLNGSALLSAHLKAQVSPTGDA